MNTLIRTGPPIASAPVVQRVVPGVLAFALLAALPGCRQGGESEKVHFLEQEVAMLREQFEAEQERLAEIETKMDELVEENREALQTARELEAKLESTPPEPVGDIEPTDNPGAKDVTESTEPPKDEEVVESSQVAESGEDVKDEVADGGNAVAAAGEDVKAEESTAEETTPPAMDKEPAPPAKPDLARERVYNAGGAVVTLTGDNRSGFGVLVTADDKVWIYSAASLVGTNTKLKFTLDDGGAIEKFGAFQVVTGADLARLEVPAGAEAALSPATNAAAVKATSPLLGYDDRLTLDGVAAAVEASVITASGDLLEQKPGSPVFHGESGELVGVLGAGAGAERSLWAATAGDTPVAPAVYRIDRPLQWTTVPIGTFLQEGRAIEETDRITRLAEAFLVFNPAAGGADLRATVGSGASVEEFFEANKSLPAVRSATELHTWLEGRGARSSAADLKRRISSVYDQLLSRLKVQIREFEKKKFSPANAPAAAQSLAWCKDAENRLVEFLRGLEGN